MIHRYAIEGNQVRDLRKEYKMSQDELANEIGVRRQAVNRIEKNKQTPSLEIAYAIAQAFDVSIEELFYFVPLNSESVNE